jgi:NAD(P)-dependent dehydrogenase (short-subunit alcohol dehydrogenase family)
VTDICGKSALVTGGGRGIGMGLAKELAKQDAVVAVADLSSEKAAQVAEEINTAGGKAVGLQCDVSDRASLERMKVEANAAFGPIQLLFANAGVTGV